MSGEAEASFTAGVANAGATPHECYTGEQPLPYMNMAPSTVTLIASTLTLAIVGK